MATSRRPAILPLRTMDLRELQQVIANIRERLEQLDAAVAAITATSVSSSASSTSSTSAQSGTALRLANERAFDLAGLVTSGPQPFDGTQNVTIEVLEVPLALLEQDSATAGDALVWDGSGGWTPTMLVDTAGTIDHGALLGLADDDHPHYLNESRGNALYSPLGHGHATSDITDLDELIEDTIGAKLVAGAGISISYDDGTGETTVENTAIGGAGDLINPMEEFGDIIVGQSAGSPARLAVGAEDQVLTVVGGLPEWADAAPGGGSGDLVNPMVDYGDLIVGESAGSPARLAPGVDGKVLTMVAGLPQWDDAPAAGDLANPMEEFGDLIVGQSGGSPARLPVGSDDQVLTVVSGVPAWAAAASGGGGSETLLVLSSDFTTTSLTGVDVAGLQFVPDADSTYVFEAFMLINTSVDGAAPRPGFYFGPDSTGGVEIVQANSLDTGFPTQRWGGNSNIGGRLNHLWSNATNHTLGALPVLCWMRGMFKTNSTPSTMGVTFAGETATGSPTYRIVSGSSIRYRKVA